MNNEREIKFRAWDKDKEEMLTPDMSEWCINFENGGIDVLESNMNFSTQEDCYISIENYELMQFTGLKDKNGKEIYEGDIIDYLGTFESGDGYRGEIKFDEGVYYFMGKSKIGRKAGVISSYVGLAHEKAYQHCEVIGNIYENSELLAKL